MQLENFFINLPHPPTGLAGVVHRFKYGNWKPLVEDGEQIRVGTPLFDRFVESESLKDNFTKFIGRGNKVQTRILSPVDGVVNWVNPNTLVSSNWDYILLDRNKENYSSFVCQNMIRIRPQVGQGEKINYEMCYREISEFSIRHIDNPRIQDWSRSSKAQIEHDLEVLKKANFVIREPLHAEAGF